MECCHKFHEYLYGNKFEELTDNNPLTYVLTTAKLDATGHRWLAELSLYDFSIKYRPGLKNGDADGLSRRSVITENEVHSICNGILAQEPPQVGLIRVNQVQAVNWQRRQNADEAVRLIASFVEVGKKPPYKEQSGLPEETKSLLRDFDMLMVTDGILYRKQQRDDQEVYQLILPKEYQKAALEGLHDNVGHLGVEKTLSLVRDRFFWPKMAKDVEVHVKCCERCIKRKTPAQVAPMTPIQATRPLEFVTMDYLTIEKAMGYENILVIIDHFTKFAQAYPAKNQKAVTTAKLVLDFIRRYGFPEKFHSDQGQNFVGKVMKNLYKLTGIKQTKTTPYHPMGNGLSERFNCTLLSMVGTLTSEKKKVWPKYLPDLVMAYNSATHHSTGYSPYFMMFGRQPRLPVDIAMGIALEDDTDDFIKNQQEIFRTAYDIASRKIREAGLKQKKYYDKGRAKKASDILTLGTQVLVKRADFQERHKIADVWEDDVYVITEQPHKDIPVYTLENQTDETVKTVHRNLLLPLPTILDWMRPYDPDILVKPVWGENNENEVNSDHEDEDSTDDDDSDGYSDSSGDEPVCIRTRSQKKKQESPIEK